jgi:thiol-disulfide isomerase/thioredoxin
MKKTILIFFLFSLMVSHLSAGSNNGPENIPDFKLKAINGELTGPSDFKGKTIIVNFWATWCPPCRKEIPALIKIQKDNPDVIILSINLDRETEKVVPFARNKGMNFPVLYGNDDVINKFGGVNLIPQTFVYGPGGNLIQKFNGMISESKLNSILAEIKKSKTL